MSGAPRPLSLSDCTPIIRPKRLLKPPAKESSFMEGMVSSSDEDDSDYAPTEMHTWSRVSSRDYEESLTEAGGAQSSSLSGSSIIPRMPTVAANDSSSATTPTISGAGSSGRETMFRLKGKHSAFLLNVTILSFFIQALLSITVVGYCLVWMAVTGFDEHVVTYLLPLLTFVLGVWLPNPSELLSKKQRREGKQRRGKNN